MVCIQPPETGLDLVEDVPSRQAPIVDALPNRLHHLGTKNDIFSPCAERPPEDLLGGGALAGWRRAWAVEPWLVAVTISAVKHVDAQIDRVANDCIGGRGAGRN